MKNIIIIPIGEVEQSIIDFLTETIPSVIEGIKCSSGEKIDLPFHLLNLSRNQFMAETILVQLILLKDKKNYNVVLGVIDYDIYAPGLNFVFGQVIDSVGIISLTRLKPQYYSKPENNELYKKRILTEAVHELGHIFELDHCNDPNCVMYFSNSIRDTDKKGYNFCDKCKRKLTDNLKII